MSASMERQKAAHNLNSSWRPAAGQSAASRIVRLLYAICDATRKKNSEEFSAATQSFKHASREGRGFVFPPVEPPPLSQPSPPSAPSLAYGQWLPIAPPLSALPSVMPSSTASPLHGCSSWARVASAASFSRTSCSTASAPVPTDASRYGAVAPGAHLLPATFLTPFLPLCSSQGGGPGHHRRVQPQPTVPLP